ncbi:primase-helicase family protein [Litoreibacter halocynthiae]|uniref:primase-helicase family protein n=1 Tax=Litoreibacter halocynthiae TaxID=1242689 RepID=UPI0024907681|nr:primase-helicase family protein [Litoreibacter halocynthiae]
MTTNNTTTDPILENNIRTICRSVARWFVRKDNKFYDINRPTTPLSRRDVEQMMFLRIRNHHPEIELSNNLIKGVFRRAIDDLSTREDQSIAVWAGEINCIPGNTDRLVFGDGAVTINSWHQPAYRTLRVNEAEYGIADEFFAAIFPRAAEREMFLNWLAWCLQNESDKPTWAPLLYSRTKGTGKSTLCQLLALLFGEDNSVTQNNVDMLTSRFNMTALRSKLVISEELQLRPGSRQATMLKSYLTETTTLSEMKGREAERVKQSCCFIFTTNHLPTWIEEGDRRFYVIEVDHSGHASGEKASEFTALIARLYDYMDDSANIAKLHAALMARSLPDSFSAKSLNVSIHATPIMLRINAASERTVLTLLEEELNRHGLKAMPESNLTAFISQSLKSSIGQTRHLMAELGWTKFKVKWGGATFSKALWVAPEFSVDRGYLQGPGMEPVKIDDHLNKAMPDELKGIEYID